MLDPLPGREPLPCSECPRVRLDQHLQFSESGRLLTSALSVDWAVRCGLHVQMDDVSYPEFLRLRLLHEERQTLEREEVDRAREKNEREQQWARQRRGRK